jgi:hypothetical protein
MKIYKTTTLERSYAFQYYCQSDSVGTESIIRRRAQSVDACIELCIERNSEKGDQECKGVTWNGNLTSSITQQQGNCFLKPGDIEVVACNKNCPLAVTAVLIDV